MSRGGYDSRGIPGRADVERRGELIARAAGGKLVIVRWRGVQEEAVQVADRVIVVAPGRVVVGLNDNTMAAGRLFTEAVA